MKLWDNRSKEEKELEMQTKAIEMAEKEKEHIDNIIDKMNERLSIQLDISRQKAERKLLEEKLKNPDAEYKRMKETEDNGKTKEENPKERERKTKR